MANTYAYNCALRLSAVFTVANVRTDPTTVTLKVRDPSSNIATYTYAGLDITKDAVGVYHQDITIDEAGTWYYRFEGTGTCKTADEKSIIIEESQFD